MDGSLPGRFATWTFRYQDPLDVSPPDDKVLQITNFETGGETSKEVLVSKRLKVQNVQVAKRPGGEPFM